jgi:V/A-type H+/Na+-transporting ATPase subunit E
LSEPVALSDLLAGLKAEAAAEEARLDAETRAEVTRIDAAAHAEARILQEQALRAVEDELRGEAEARRARARLAAAATVRQAREEAFQEFLAEVRRRLETVRESCSYPTVLRALLRESLTALPAAAVLRVDPRDERLATDLLGELGAELRIAATLETAGGVELTRGEGRVVRNTVEERFANAEPALRLLFGRAQPEAP